MNRNSDVSNLRANTSTELVWRCFLLLEHLDINIKSCSIISYLRDIFQIATSDINRKFRVLPATTHLAWDKDEEVIRLSSDIISTPPE